LGVDLYLNERYSAALQALPDEQEAKTSLLGDYVMYYRGKSHLSTEQGEEALNCFRLLQNQFPNSPFFQGALIGECQALLKMRKPMDALAVLTRPGIDVNLETLYYEARALHEAGEKGKAIEFYLQVYSKDPSPRFSQLAIRYLLELSPGALSGSRNYVARLQRADTLIQDGNAHDARVLLLALGRARAPDSPSLQKRNLLLGEVEYRLGRTTAALPYLRKVTAADPELHARAIYLEGVCCRKLKREQAFLALRDKALNLYPKSLHTEELCYSVATYFDVNYDPSNAREAYQVLYDSFPKGRHAERSLWKLALASYFEKKSGEAALRFWNYLLAYRHPSSASSAMYWMARCYAKIGDIGRAKYLYGRVRALTNYSYLGQLAREGEESLEKQSDPEASPAPVIDFNQVVQTCDSIQLPPALMPEPEGTAMQVLVRARELANTGLPDLALNELRWGSRRNLKYDDAFSYVMSRIYEAKEDYISTIASLRRAFPDHSSRPRDSLPKEVWQLLFPVRHWEIISAQAEKTGVDPALILGVIRQESGFDENARSKANARGLMQILPSTGRRLARQARIARYSATKLYQADANIILGTRHLASLLKQYGREELALAAYNAGDTRADRWLKEFGPVDMPEFVELIPFSETRNYVKQVLTNKAHYNLQIASAAR
jgi:soluble lytic murein transglycosylase